MHLHVRIHRWIVWWIYVGIVCGAVALVNILVREPELNRTQEGFILILGVLYWVMGGLVCWAFEGIRVRRPLQPPKKDAPRKSALTHS